jgi:hypothetical protein
MVCVMAGGACATPPWMHADGKKEKQKKRKNSKEGCVVLPL